MKFDKKLSQNL